MAQVSPYWYSDAEARDGDDGAHPHGDPHPSSDGRGKEHNADADLVKERQSEGEVEAEMHHPPGFVFETPSGDPGRRDPGGDQENEGSHRLEDVRVVNHEDPELFEESDARRLRVPPRDQDDVERDEHDGPAPDTPVPAHESVLPTLLSSQGMRDISTTITNRRYVPTSAASRAANVYQPPGARRAPRDSPQKAIATARPRPIPAITASASVTLGAGAGPGRRRGLRGGATGRLGLGAITVCPSGAWPAPTS